MEGYPASFYPHRREKGSPTLSGTGKANPGHFQPGFDPRRHVFTREECCLGYERALESIDRRYPGCDAHCMMAAMIGSKPFATVLRDMILAGVDFDALHATSDQAAA